MRHRRLILALAVVFGIDGSARAMSVVTEVTISGTVVGNSDQIGLIAVTVSCGPGAS
jgi:hypothetical protein